MDEAYGSDGEEKTVTPSARARTSSTSRDFPMPGMPTTSTSRPRPLRASSSEVSTVCSSCSRPAMGSSIRPARFVPVMGPTANACTGCFLPFTKNGSRGVTSKVARDRSSTSVVARIWPGAARAITRAARFTASPLTEYVRR